MGTRGFWHRSGFSAALSLAALRCQTFGASRSSITEPSRAPCAAIALMHWATISAA